MTTQDFIYRKLQNTTRKEFCSSVFGSTDMNGDVTIYSYGYHYPLARIINGKAYINNRGYSNTTAKHIHWARQASVELVGYDNTYSVPLTNGNSLNTKGIRESASREYARVTEEMSKKKRKDTYVYKDLQNTEVRMIQVLQSLEVQ